MIRFMLVAWVFVLAATPKGCGNKYEEVILNEPFILGIGECVRLEDEDVGMCFRKVITDSRCPTGVNCVWPGAVTVLIETGEKGSPSQRLELTLNAPPGPKAQAAVGKWQFTLLEVEPYPAEDVSIEQDEYIAEFVIGLAARE